MLLIIKVMGGLQRTELLYCSKGGLAFINLLVELPVLAVCIVCFLCHSHFRLSQRVNEIGKGTEIRLMVCPL